jgi:hypothetical protein
MLRVLFPVAFGCGGPDVEIVVQDRCLVTPIATYDAGLVPVGERETVDVLLQSTCSGPV